MDPKFSEAATAAFTGHRFFDFSRKEEVKARLTASVLDAYEHGITRFMTGMAVGFDMLAAEVVLSMKGLCPGIKLMAVIPYSGQAERFCDYNHRRYDALLAQADETIVLSDQYYTRCFLERDRFMVEHSSMLIACYDGREKGGTFWTVRLAESLARRVVNVY